MTNPAENGGDALDITESENGDSTSSELERLNENTSPTPSSRDTPTERGIARTKRQEEKILRTIEQTKALGANTLDLSNHGLLIVPSELLELTNLEHLYLEGNQLTSIPDDFFDRLPNLKWLDLRHNYLIRLPSVFTGRHQNLRNLLLEGNNLRTLPLELGMIKTLNGLNITNNPLEFPPARVIEKGTAEILKFLREMMAAKNSGRLLNGTRVHTGLRQSQNLKLHSARLASQQFPPDQSDGTVDEDGNRSSSSSDDWSDDGGDLREYAYRRVQQRSMSTEEANRMSALAKAELVGPVNKSAELHTQLSYTERKQAKTAKIQKAGAMGTVERKKSLSTSSIFSWKVNQFPEPPPPEYALLKLKEEQKLAKEREFKEKTDAILQRRKDENILKEWRDESKRMQRKKAFETLRKGTKEYPDTATEAPFGIDEDHLRIPSNEERIKHDIKTAHEKLRRTLSPSSRQRIEEEKAARIKELEKRIKQHTTQMHERRKLPKGTPQEEMEAARRELEVVKLLQKDLLRRYQELKMWTTG
ncbi:hypothetical protein CHS0354_021028 [Potamilus streckersoni]|uniref:Leucine-rich repeat-containing protein 27 n=1 Tax=Potamilus streckersoni TaxID=2493646 RepID=A0AAE0VTM8_9BIVA|nr:hypothetical protein CHS0354_021028 [Potamilus streckersoni]